jgi:hypothetical protein
MTSRPKAPPSFPGAFVAKERASTLVPLGPFVPLVPLAALPCALALVLASSACTEKPTPAFTPSPPPQAQASATAVPVSRWQPIPVPPGRNVAPSRTTFGPPPVMASFDTAEGQGLIDDTGTRWLFSAPQAEPAAPEPIPGGPPAAIYFDVRRGFAILTRDHRLLASKTFLGELAPLFSEPLPAAVDPKKLRWFHDGLTAVAQDSGAAYALRAGHLEPLTAPKELRFADVLLGADGAGVALFLPEQVGITTDFGQSWKLVALPGVSVTALRAQGADEGGHALLLPGGVRDGFPRSVDPRTGVVERAIAGTDTTQVVAPSHPGGLYDARPSFGSKRRRSLMLEPESFPPPELRRATLPAAPDKPTGALRFSAPSSLLGQGDSVSLDGDDVLLIGSVTDPLTKARMLQAHRGRLGEGVKGVGKLLPACVVASTATCGTKSALLCAGTVHLFENDEPVAQIALPNATHLTFAPDGTVLAATSESGRGAAKLVVPRLMLHHLPFPPPGTPVPAAPVPAPEGIGLDELGNGLPAFIGGCHSPAIWIRSGETAARYLPAERRFAAPRAIELLQTAHGVNHEGALVVSNDKSIDLITDDDTAPSSFAWGERISSGHLSFAQDGRHGLLVAPSGQVSQTNDGGHSFQPIDTPAVAHSLPVLCGATRCQLGSGVFREGFDRDAAKEITTWPAPNLPSSPVRRLFAPPVVLTCHPDKAFSFADYDALVLTPRIGTSAASTGAETFFAGAALESKDQGSLIWGDTSGKLTTQKLRLPPTSKDSPERESAARGTGAFVARRWENGDDRIRTTFRWDPTDSTTTLTTSEVSPVGDRVLLRTDGAGLGFLDFRKSDAVLWGKTPLERRSLDLLEAAWGGGSGLVHVEPDGTWILLQMFPDAENGSVRLDVVPSPSTGSKLRGASRTLVVASHTLTASVALDRSEHGLLPPPLEFGAGVDSTGDGDRRVALWERTEDGGSELRLRSLTPDLSLGAATAVPHTRTKQGDLLVLPSCPAAPPGMLVWLETRATMRAVTQQERVDGPLVRLLRVTPTSACVERTFVAAAAGDLSSSLVLTGNGEHGAQKALGSVACEPIAATVPPGEELATPKPPRIRIPGKK